MGPWLKVKLLQVTVHSISVIGLVYFWNVWMLIAAIVWGYFLYLFGGSIGFHRIWSHRYTNVSDFVKYGTAFLGTLMGVGSCVAFAAPHRQHHAFSDVSKELDPYWSHDDYSFKGTLHSYMTIPHPTPIKLSMIKDLMRDKYVWFMHENYFVIVFAWVAVLAIIDPLLVLYGFCIPSVICYLCSQVTGVFGHRVGEVIYKDNGDKSKNSTWFNVLSLGEAYQNTHHKYPNRVVMGKYDIAGYLLLRLSVK